MSRFFALILVLGMLVLAGCVTETTQTPGAIAVWQQDEGNDWNIRYSLWDDAAKKWYTPNGGTTELIADLSGADHDPYIDSDGADTAISVWSHVEGGSADIYYSVWKADSWSTPARVGSGLAGYDSDPAVAMDTHGNAVAVWVNKNTDGTTMLYYSVYNGQWSTPAIITREQTTVSLPELSFSPTSGIYFLIWTEATSAGTRVFSSGYSGGTWAPPIEIPGQDKSAILDNKVPTDERIGLGTAGKKRETIAVWASAGGELYSSTWTPAGWSKAVKYGEKKMPDAEYEYGGVPYSLFIKNDDLYWSRDLYSANGVTPVPGTGSDYRPAITFIGDRIIGLGVYWTTVDSPSEIYYTRWDGSAWEPVAPIDPNLVAGQDRNPDVSPLLKEDQLWDYYFDWCGDGILQWPNIWGQFEECEVGIPCKNPADFCNAHCLCVPDYGNNTWCGDGIIQRPNSAGVMEDCEVGVPCANPNELCNVAACKCEPQDQPPPPGGEDELPPGGTGDDGAGEGTGEGEDDAAGTCGDGKIEANEECDIGGGLINGVRYGAAPETCPMGTSCQNCECGKGEVTPRCGDGYISGPEQGANEECDTGGYLGAAILPDTCPPPTHCSYICRCEEEGTDDGMHYACIEGGCELVSGEGPNQCLYDYNCRHYECQGEECVEVFTPGENECLTSETCQYTHLECEEGECVEKYGQGSDECEHSDDCYVSHLECEDGECIEVEGAGSDQCQADYECQEYHMGCDDGECVEMYGPGQDTCEFDEDCYEVTYEYCGDGIIQEHLDEQCESDNDCDGGVCSYCQCVYPPELDCDKVCGATTGADLFGSDVTSSECGELVEYDTPECTTTCTYAKFYSSSNAAGTSTCCCGAVKYFDCTDCPGQNPQCPDSSICDANTPDWYQLN